MAGRFKKIAEFFALPVCLLAVLALVAPAEAKKRSAPAKIFIQTSSAVINGADQKPRLTARCPRKKTIVPVAGGMFATPSPGADGEGVYPHSFERLGAQGGWHVTPVLYDPSPGSTTPRRVTLQVVCGPKTRIAYPVRKTIFVQPGEDASTTVKCPGKRRIFAGGFQRTNFVSRGGNYPTSARLTSPKTWRVSGSAFGNFGGELTAIAYCRASKKPILKTVSATTAVAPGDYGAAKTPSCPGKNRLVSGGFSTFPSTSSFFADGYIEDNGWVAGIYNNFGPTTFVTAYGYCHPPKFPRATKGEKNKHRSVKAPKILQRAEKAAISVRVVLKGCYPAPANLAKRLQRRTGIKAGTARGPKQVRKAGRIYVLTKGASCDQTRLSARVKGKVYTINSKTGTVRAR